MKKILIIILLGIFVPTLRVQAFSLSPLRYVFSVDRGQSVEASVILNNYDLDTTVLEPVVVGIKTDSAGRPVFDSSSEIIGWVKADWNFATLKEGDEKKVKFSITVPIGVYPGDYYLGIGARRSSSGGSAVSIGEQLLTLVNVKVAGEAREDLFLKRFKVVESLFKENKSFNLGIENRGNVEMPINASLKVFDWRGNIINEAPVEIGNKILPMAERMILVKGMDTIKYPGLYQADLTINYGLTKQKITAVQKFWYCPIWVFIAGFSLFALIIILLIFIFKQHSHAVK